MQKDKIQGLSIKIKAVLLTKAQEKLQFQIQDMESQLAELFKAGAEHGKSSAGDKYETQGEMLKQSRHMLEVQLSRTKQMLDQLNRIPLQAVQSVQEGALIKLSMGCLWISVPLGKLEHEGHEYQLISKDAPLSLTLKSLKTGESCLFRGKKMVVEELI